MKKRIFSMLLAAIILTSTVGCNGNNSETKPSESVSENETTNAAGEETESVDSESAETEETDYVSTLPKADYEGHEFRIESANSLAGVTSATTINIAEELTGEIVNDALYNRDRYLEQQYNITIKNSIVEARDAVALNKLVLAGDTGLEVSFGDIASFGGYLMLNG